MKKLVVMVLSLMIGCVSIGSAQAAEVSVAKLHMKITSKINDKVYALCLSDTCYPLVAKGKFCHHDRHERYDHVYPKNAGILPGDRE
jgi:hypothetical protein